MEKPPKNKCGRQTTCFNSRFYIYIYSLFLLKRYPSNFVTLLTEHWYEGGVYHIRFARRSEMRKLLKHTESLKRMWRRFPGRFQEEIPVWHHTWSCNVSVCFAASSWLGKSTNSTRSRKSCSAEKISWVPTDSESCQHLPWILLIGTSNYYQAVGFQKGWTISMRCIIIIIIAFLYATILLLVHVIDMRFASRVSMKER